MRYLMLTALLSSLLALAASEALASPDDSHNTVRKKKKDKPEPKGGLIDPFGSDPKQPGTTGPSTGGGGGGGKFIDPFAPGAGGTVGGGSGSGSSGGGRFIDPFATGGSGGGKKKK